MIKPELLFDRFDIAFKKLDTMDQFEEEFGEKHSHGAWHGSEYIASYCEIENPKKLITLFRRYEAEGLAEQGSGVRCTCWISLKDYEQINQD